MDQGTEATSRRELIALGVQEIQERVCPPQVALPHAQKVGQILVCAERGGQATARPLAEIEERVHGDGSAIQELLQPRPRCRRG